MAAKLAARRATHKTDVGVVLLTLPNDDVRRRPYGVLGAPGPLTTSRANEGVLIQSMITGVETMIGVADDPLFGPLVAFGLGGIHVEVLGDVRFRVAPLTDRDADELLHGIRGFRCCWDTGTPARRSARVARAPAPRLEAGLRSRGDLKLDLNPVMALPPGTAAASSMRASASRAGDQVMIKIDNPKEVPWLATRKLN